jgi:hypothetical protein
MFTFASRLFKSLFPILAEYRARRRARLVAQHRIGRHARVMRLCLEGLEERIVPDAYAFEHMTPLGFQASVGTYTDVTKWWDLSLGGAAQQLPGAADTADIPVGASCTLNSSEEYYLAGLTVEGSMTVGSNLTVAPNGSAGNGSTSVAAGGGLVVGNPSNPGSSPAFDTTTLTDLGTVTVGAAAGGSVGTLDATTVSVGGGSGSGTFYIGDPGTGSTGTVDVSGGLSVGSSALLQVGGVGSGGSAGSSGKLDVGTLTTAVGGGPGTFNFIINTNGETDVASSGTLAGASTLAGVLQADNIDAFSGASITITGSAVVPSGPLKGNLIAEIQASFTFAAGSTVTLGTPNALGDGQFNLEGALVVNTALYSVNSEYTMFAGGTISGTGSFDLHNHEFNWEGGTIGGLTGGGFTIDNNADFKTTGSGTKTLATSMVNLGTGVADFGGTGTLSIDGPGSPAGSGSLLNLASAVEQMEISLPVLTESVDTSPAVVFTNAGYLEINQATTVIISAPIYNETGAYIESNLVGAGLTLSDTSGLSTLNGNIEMTNGTVTIPGIYTSTADLTATANSTTVTGTLTINGGATDDFDHLILGVLPSNPGTITGAGDLSINASGLGSGDYFKWMYGDVSGTGILTIGPYATFYLLGTGTLYRELENQGIVDWEGNGGVFFSGVTVNNDPGALFDYQTPGPGFVSVFNNSGTLELGAYALEPLTVGTFTQTNEGTLQSDIASATSYGTLSVLGSATLAGTVDGYLLDNYQPPAGTSFGILGFASSSGQFTTVEPLGWSAVYSSTSVDLVS